MKFSLRIIAWVPLVFSALSEPAWADPPSSSGGNGNGQAADTGAQVSGQGQSSPEPLAATATSSSSTPEMMPADSLTVSPGNVSIRDGRYRASGSRLEIGGGAPGFLKLEGQDEIIRPAQEKGGRVSGWLGRNLNAKLSASKDCQLCSISRMSVSFGEISDSFSVNMTYSGTGYLYSGTNFSKLAVTVTSPSAWTAIVTTTDGSVVNFQPGSLAGSNYMATSVVSPDGVRYDYSYTGQGPGGNLQKIVSNTGYAMVFEYADANNPYVYTKACVINLSAIVYLRKQIAIPIYGPTGRHHWN